LEFPEFNAKRLEELVLKLEAGKPTGGWIHAYSNYKSMQENVNKLRAEKGYIEVGRAIKEAEGTWFKTMDDTLKILYDELMGKVFSRFEKGEKVVIIPNRALNILPLHACFYEESPAAIRRPLTASGPRKADSDKRRYLLEDYDINYAPNCNILDMCHRREKGRRKNNLFAIANPAPPYELAFSEWEVEEIAKLFDNKEVFSKQEAKDALVNNADSYEVIHLSSHGIYDLGSSFNSRLRLGKDSDLTLEEIFEKVRVNKSWLVCLSACESGLTDYRDIADEYIGLQTGFLCAGAPTVIASLWTINDFPTAFIMIKTYESIFKEGLKKSEALRKAQLWLKELTAEDALKLLKDKELELESSVKMAVKDISPLKIAISSKDPKSKPFSHP
jgi:CHAT domain-containing protein